MYIHLPWFPTHAKKCVNLFYSFFSSMDIGEGLEPRLLRSQLHSSLAHLKIFLFLRITVAFAAAPVPQFSLSPSTSAALDVDVTGCGAVDGILRGLGVAGRGYTRFSLSHGNVYSVCVCVHVCTRFNIHENLTSTVP